MNKNLSKFLTIIIALFVFSFVYNMLSEGEPQPLPMNQNVEFLEGNYSVVGDVQGQLLLGYKPPYAGDVEDGHAYNAYINTSSYADIGLVDVYEQTDRVDLKSISFDGSFVAVDGQPTNETAHLTNFFSPCYSEHDQKIYQIAHRYKKGAYNNSGRRVLLSFTLDGEYELFTPEILGTGYIEDTDPFYVSQYRDCKIEIAGAYEEKIGKPCAELNLPFTCIDLKRVSAPYEVIEVQKIDFTDSEVVSLMAWANKSDGWPVEVEIIKPGGTKQSMVLPIGPFVQESGFFKKMQCFSCGCSCYQKLSLSLIDDALYLIASGWAIDDEVRGVYRLVDNQTWEKVLYLSAHESYFKQIGACVLSWEVRGGDENPFHNNGVRWVNMCASP